MKEADFHRSYSLILQGWIALLHRACFQDIAHAIRDVAFSLRLHPLSLPFSYIQLFYHFVEDYSGRTLLSCLRLSPSV